MSTILTVGVSAELGRLFAAAGEHTVTRFAIRNLDTDGGLIAKIEETSPVAVVLGPGVRLDKAFALAGRLDVAGSTSVVLVAADPDAALWVAAIRAGVRDVLAPEADADEVAAVLARADERTEERAVSRVVPSPTAQQSMGRVVVVASPKGGVGKTTLATNLAVGLAQAGAGSTVVVDLDLQFGDVASALALVPEYTLPDTVHGAASTDPLVLKTFLSRHSSGLHVVAGSDSPAAGDAVSAEQVGQLIDTLAREFRFVVVDTAPGLSDHTLAALERSTDLVLVSSMDVPGVRGMRKELDVLTELDLVPAGRHLVINMADLGGPISLADIATTIGSEPDVVLPRSAAVTLSTNVGVPLLESGARDAVTKGLQTLLDRLLPARSDTRTDRDARVPGLLGRLRAGSR